MDNDKDLDSEEARQAGNGVASSAELQVDRIESVDSVVSQMTVLSVSEAPSPAGQPQELEDISASLVPGADLDKKIRAIKKKVVIAFSRATFQSETLSTYSALMMNFPIFLFFGSSNS